MACDVVSRYSPLMLELIKVKDLVWLIASYISPMAEVATCHLGIKDDKVMRYLDRSGKLVLTVTRETMFVSSSSSLDAPLYRLPRGVMQMRPFKEAHLTEKGIFLIDDFGRKGPGWYRAFKLINEMIIPMIMKKPVGFFNFRHTKVSLTTAISSS